MADTKLPSPVDENIIFDPTINHVALIGCHQHQGFIEQVFDYKPRNPARVVHHADVEYAIRELAHQAG